MKGVVLYMASAYTPPKPSERIYKGIIESSTALVTVYMNAVRIDNKQHHNYRTIKIKKVFPTSAACQPWRLTATSIVIDPRYFPECLAIAPIREDFLQALNMYFRKDEL